MMNFPGIYKLHNIKIPGQRLEAHTPVLIRFAPRLKSEFIFLDTEVESTESALIFWWERQTLNNYRHTNIYIYSKRVIIKVEGAVM